MIGARALMVLLGLVALGTACKTPVAHRYSRGGGLTAGETRVETNGRSAVLYLSRPRGLNEDVLTLGYYQEETLVEPFYDQGIEQVLSIRPTYFSPIGSAVGYTMLTGSYYSLRGWGPTTNYGPLLFLSSATGTSPSFWLVMPVSLFLAGREKRVQYYLDETHGGGWEPYGYGRRLLQVWSPVHAGLTMKIGQGSQTMVEERFVEGPVVAENTSSRRRGVVGEELLYSLNGSMLHAEATDPFGLVEIVLNGDNPDLEVMLQIKGCPGIAGESIRLQRNAAPTILSCR